MSVFKEFREFALKGSVVDLAVGVIIGAAFGSIVSTLVDHVIMPPIGLMLAGIDFSALKWVLQAGVPAIGVEGQPGYVAAQPEVSIDYGLFINAVIKFTIVAWILFLVIKGVNAMKRKEEAKPATAPEKPEDVKLLGEIRDLLKQRP